MRRERRTPSPLFSLLRSLLLLTLGVLVGANAMYYAMTHDIGRRLGLHGGTDDARVETPLRLPASPAVDDKSAMPPATSASPPASSSPASSPAPMPAPVASTVATPTTSTRLLIPVQGVTAAHLQDTFADARGEGRVHDAIDIMAPAGTPVLAVADGHVEKLFDSKQGGLTLYQFDPSGTYAYYYAHLQGYAPGIAEKKAIRRGETIGYVGSTGNANPAAPHLHFAIFVLGPEKQWWKGQAINPYPLLGGAPR